MSSCSEIDLGSTGRVSAEAVVAIEVDSRGRPCPLPVIDLAKAMAGVEIGGDVVVLADDPGAAADIPAWCRMRRQHLVDVTPVEGHTRYQVRRIV